MYITVTEKFWMPEEELEVVDGNKFIKQNKFYDCTIHTICHLFISKKNDTL